MERRRRAMERTGDPGGRAARPGRTLRIRCVFREVRAMKPVRVALFAPGINTQGDEQGARGCGRCRHPRSRGFGADRLEGRGAHAGRRRDRRRRSRPRARRSWVRVNGAIDRLPRRRSRSRRAAGPRRGDAAESGDRRGRAGDRRHHRAPRKGARHEARHGRDHPADRKRARHLSRLRSDQGLARASPPPASAAPATATCRPISAAPGRSKAPS